MSVREYVGARYVPIFGRVGEDTTQWDNTAPYEPLTIVTDHGVSFTSRQYVPVGIPLTDSNYWVETGNFNAQVEAYRREVQTFDGRITANAEAIADNVEAITGLDGRLDTVEDMFPVQTGDIADGAIITNKLAAGAVTTQKLADESVNYYKLATDSVTTSKIKDNDVTDAKIANAYTEMVVIGDSWCTTGYDAALNQLWWYLFAQRNNLHAHNYAVSGQGYVHGTKTFTMQLDDAIADDTFDHNKVKYVFIFGSLNDKSEYNANESNALNVIRATANKAKTNFPRATVVCIGPENPINADALITRMTNTMYTNLMQDGHVFIPMTWVTLGISWATNPDRLYHPTVNGQAMIAGYVENCLFGKPFVRDRVFHAVNSSIDGCTLSTAELQIHNNNVLIKVVGHSTGDTDGSFTFENDVLKALDIYNSPIIGINTSGASTFIAITSSGIQLHDHNAHAANNYYSGVLQVIA